MSRLTSVLSRVSIAATDTFSAWIKEAEFHGSAVVILVYGPAVLEAHTYTVQVTEDPDATTPVLHTLQTAAGVDVALPVALKAKPMPELVGSVAFRIFSDGAITVAAQATWKFSVSEEA